MKVKCYLEIDRNISSDANLVALEGQNIKGKFKFSSYPTYWKNGDNLEIEIHENDDVIEEQVEKLLSEFHENFVEKIPSELIDNNDHFGMTSQDLVNETMKEITIEVEEAGVYETIVPEDVGEIVEYPAQEVGVIKYPIEELDNVDLDFQVGRENIIPKKGRKKNK